MSKTKTTELENILNELNTVFTAASVDLDAVPNKTRAGWEANKREAQVKLPSMRLQYKNAFNKAAYNIAVFGQARNTFAELAADEGGGVFVDVDAVYNRLTDTVENTMGKSREFTPSCLMTMLLEMQQIGMELGVTMMDTPNFTGAPYCNSRQDTYNVVRQYIESKFNTALQKLYVENTAINTAIREGAAGTVVPVILTGSDEDNVKSLASALFSGRYVAVDTDKEPVNNNLVVKTFNQIKKALKPNNKTETEVKTETNNNEE